MDRLLYISMSGMNRTLSAQANNTQNVSNLSTTGFKATLSNAVSRPIEGDGHASRVNVASEVPSPDFTPGALKTTGNSLDVAIEGQGWIAVQDDNGEPALTRRGDLRIDSNGLLRTGDGRPVLGNAGPVAVPPNRDITIGSDGTVSIVPLGQGPQAQAVLDRIMLVQPDNATLNRGPDGLFRAEDGELPPPNAEVTLVSGALEASNVNMAEALVEMVSISREFEMQARMLRVANENSQASARLLRFN